MIDFPGAQKNFSQYAALFNATGVRVLLENCHEGAPARHAGSDQVHCPMHLFRTSGDIRPTYGAIVKNLLTVNKCVPTCSCDQPAVGDQPAVVTSLLL